MKDFVAILSSKSQNSYNEHTSIPSNINNTSSFVKNLCFFVSKHSGRAFLWLQRLEQLLNILVPAIQVWMDGYV